MMIVWKLNFQVQYSTPEIFVPAVLGFEECANKVKSEFFNDTIAQDRTESRRKRQANRPSRRCLIRRCSQVNNNKRYSVPLKIILQGLLFSFANSV